MGDITKLDIDNLPDFDLLTGWFPCQDVSIAWKQNLEGGRTVLVEYLLQILEKKKPKYFIFENVKWLMGKKNLILLENRQPKILFNKFNNRIMEWISWALGTWSWFTNKQWYMICHNTRSREFLWTWFKDIPPTLCVRDYKDPKQMTNWLVIRKLSAIEYERLQGFPDNYTSICSNSQRYKQMWNTVSVPVVKKIFDNLF